MSEHYEDDDGDVHAAGADGNDYVLCGDAPDGEGGDRHMALTKRKINCFRCVAVINAAKRIRPNEIEDQSQ